MTKLLPPHLRPTPAEIEAAKLAYWSEVAAEIDREAAAEAERRAAIVARGARIREAAEAERRARVAAHQARIREAERIRGEAPERAPKVSRGWRGWIDDETLGLLIGAIVLIVVLYLLAGVSIVPPLDCPTKFDC